MKLTDALKTWLRDNKEVAGDAEDNAYSKAAADALVDGSLSNDEFVLLTKDPDAEKANVLADKFDKLLDAVVANQAELKELATAIATKPEMKKVESNVTERTIANSEETDGDVVVNVITADKQYDSTKGIKYFPATTKDGRRHGSAGRRFSEAGRYIDEQSELDRAVCGAFAKWSFFGPLAERGILPKSVINEHDKQLVQYALHNMKWGGVISEFGKESDNGIEVKDRKLQPHEIKQIYDESGASRGMELVPIVFDDAIITTPLLHSEYFPRVNLINVPRGRRMEGASLSTMTVTWTGTESDAITLETTAAFVTAFDTNIHVASGSILIGLDFLSDTPVNFGDYITQLYGQQLLFDLDRVIVDGDGSAEPTGFNTDVGTAVAFSNAWSYANIVALMFAVTKAYTQNTDKNRVVFGGTEATYADLRGLATGITNDTRPVFGTDMETWSILGHPFLPNAAYAEVDLAYVNLARYRMYRRLGMTLAATTEGRTLTLANQMLMTMRARFGGQMEDVSAIAYTNTGEAGA